MTTLTRRQKLRALAEAHDAWVERHLADVSAEFEPREYGSDYNIHNVDIDADGAIQDELAAVSAEIFGATEPLVADAAFEERHPRDAEGQFTEVGGTAGSFTERLASALTGREALNAAPARLTPAPKGHQGHYEGERLDGPSGMGSVRALSEYEGVEYQSINSVLRGAWSKPREYARWENPTPEQIRRDEDFRQRQLTENMARVAEIDKTMSVSQLKSDVRVERVIKNGAQVFGNDAWFGEMNLSNTDDFDEQDRLYDRWIAGERPNLTGLRWVDHGFQSTTADPTVAPRFGERWVRLNNPSDGEPVIMTYLVPEGTGGVQLSGIGQEAEILLERGLVQEVVADHGVDSDGFRRLDVRVVGRHGDG